MQVATGGEGFFECLPLLIRLAAFTTGILSGFTIVALLGLCKNQKNSNFILSRVNPGWIFYADFRNIIFFVIGGHLPCPLFILNLVLLGLRVDNICILK